MTMLPSVFSGLRFRLYLLVLLAILPALVLILYGASEQRRIASIEVQERALQSARLAASNHQKFIEEGYLLLAAVGQLPAVRESYPTDCAEIFTNLQNQYSYFKRWSVIKPGGDISCRLAEVPAGTGVASQRWFQRLVNTHEFVIGDYQINEPSGKGSVVLAYPLLDQSGHLFSVLAVELDLSYFKQFAERLELPPKATLTVTDSNGVILVEYPETLVSTSGTNLESGTLGILLEKEEGIARIPNPGSQLDLVGFTSLHSGAGTLTAYIIIRIPEDVAFARANNILFINLVALGLVTLLAFVAAWFGGEWFILRTINALLLATNRLSAGDLSARTGLAAGTSELGQLGIAFDSMAQTLQQREEERLRSEEEIRRREASAQALVRTAGRLNNRLDLESVLQAVCEESAQALNVPASSVRLLDRKQNVLYYAWDYGLPIEKRVLAKPIPRISYDELTRRVGPIHVLEDVSQFPDLPDAHRFAILGIQSAVVTSMVREGQLVGSLNIYSFVRQAFTSDELSLLHGLAHQAALAIANARLYDALQNEEHARAELLRQTITAQEDERKRIARELHDETSQSVSTLLVGLEAVRMAYLTDASNVERHLSIAQTVARGMLENVYRLIADLRPTVLDDLGLVPALLSFGEQRLAPMGIDLQLRVEGLHERLPPHIETTLFRIFQEAITNVVRHSNATVVSVSLIKENGILQLQVVDDGEGFEETLQDPPGSGGRGLGLRGMYERAKLIEGNILVTSSRDLGTKISVELPLESVNGREHG